MKKSKVLSLMTCAAVLSSSFALNVATVSAASPITLTWYVVGNGQTKDQDKVDAAASKYLKSKGLNVNLKIKCFDWGTYDQKMRTMVAAGENFDICFTSSWANNYQQQAIKGAFVPLSKYFKKELKKTADQLGPVFLKGTKIDGNNFAIPANKEKAHQWGVIVRADIVKKYKFDLSKVKKLADLEPFFKVVKEKEKGMYPVNLGGSSTLDLADFDRVGDDKFPGVVENNTKDFKVFNEFTSPRLTALFKLAHKWYNAGYQRKDVSTIKDTTPDMKADKVFCVMQPLKPGKDDEMTNATGKPWTQIELTDPIIANRDVSGSMQAISVTSKHPTEAAKFLELFNTDKFLNNLINFGIEGTHFKKVKGKTDVIELTSSNLKSNAYNPGTAWMFGNQFINYLMSNEDPKKWQKFLAFNNRAKGTNTLGFVFDPTNVKAEIAACNTVWDKYVPSLTTGTVEPSEYLPKTIAAFKSAGMDKIIAEKQKQLNAWVKKNK